MSHLHGRMSVYPGVSVQVALDGRPNDPIADAMQAGAAPVPEFIAFAFAIIQSRKSPGLVIDLGCHLGMFSIPVAASGVEVLAIDANSKNIKLLEETAKLNGWSNLQTLYSAVSDHAGSMGLLFDGPYGRVVDDPAGQVPSATLDDIVGNRKVSVIKLDIEGSEPKAIQGATRTLTANEDIVVICESNRPLLQAAGSSPAELWGLFQRLGFDCYEFFGNKLIPCTPGRIQERTTPDFVAVRKSTFQLPAGYHIGPATMDEMVEMYLTEARSGHIAFVREALVSAPREITQHPQIAALLSGANS